MATKRKTTTTTAPATVDTASLSQEERTLVNWLTRVLSLDDLGRLVVDADHEDQRPLIEPRLRKALALGLPVVPGAYIPRPGRTEGASTDTADTTP